METDNPQIQHGIGRQAWLLMFSFAVICTMLPPLPLPPTNALVASRAVLCVSQLVHLCDPLLELLILALLIAVSLCLQSPTVSPNYHHFSSKVLTYLTLPREVELFVPTAIQRYKEVCTAISVCKREFCIGHCLPGCSCSKALARIPIALHNIMRLRDPPPSNCRIGRPNSRAEVASPKPTVAFTLSITVILCNWSRRAGVRGSVELVVMPMATSSPMT
jgi:hypothetical protein